MVQVRALGAYLPSLIPENGEKGAVVKCYSAMDRKGRKTAKRMEITMRVDLVDRMHCAKGEVPSITYQATANTPLPLGAAHLCNATPPSSRASTASQ